MDQKIELILWIFESIYALSTIIISGYMRGYMRVFFLLSKLDKQLSKSDK